MFCILAVLRPFVITSTTGRRGRLVDDAYVNNPTSLSLSLSPSLICLSIFCCFVCLFGQKRAHEIKRFLLTNDKTADEAENVIF